MQYLLASSATPTPVTREQVLEETPAAAHLFSVVAAYYGVTEGELWDVSREARIAQPRHVAMYLLRQDLRLSFPVIGRLFRRDHSTVIYAVRKIGEASGADSDLRADLRVIRGLAKEEG